MILPFDKTNGFNELEWSPIANAYKDWQGMGEAVFRKPVRTPKQNKALHKWFELLAIEANKTGVPFSVNIGNKMEILRNWDKEAVKRELYHPVMRSITKKNSTAELDTKEIDEVAEPISLWLADEWKIVVPFPSQESLVNNMLEKQ